MGSDQGELLPAPNIAAIHEADVLASLSAFARGFGTRRETLRERILHAGVEPVGRRAGSKLYRLADVYAAWITSPASGADPDALSPFQRRAWWQSESERLRVGKARGELCVTADVERQMAELTMTFLQVLETAPDVLERDLGLPTAVLDRLENHFAGVREELYRRLSAQDEEPHVETPSAPEQASAPQTAIETAAVFLEQALASGGRAPTELIGEAAAVGISETTLRRAKAELGVLASRRGRGWIWHTKAVPQ